MCQDQEAFQEAEAGLEARGEALPEGTGPDLGQEVGPGEGQDPDLGLDLEEEEVTGQEVEAGVDPTEETGLLMDSDYMLETSMKTAEKRTWKRFSPSTGV